MAVIVGQRAFLHVPKTGGMWLRRVLEANGIDYKIFISKEASTGFDAQLVDQSRQSGRHHNAAVPLGMTEVYMVEREPVGWYESVWLYRLFPPRASEAFQFDFFDDFLTYTLRRYPAGFLHQVYAKYRSVATHVINFAHLEAGLSLVFGDIEFPPATNQRTRAWTCAEETALAIKLYESEVARRHNKAWILEET